MVPGSSPGALNLVAASPPLLQMTLDPEFLSILRTPDSKRPLAPMEPAALTALNQAIAAGQVRDRGGEVVAEPLEAALEAQGEAVVYPIRDGIPDLLVERALDWPPGATGD